jgi:quercetin dioxygenase-like cupin family protein
LIADSTPLQRHVVRGAETPVDSFPWGTIQWLDGQALTGTETLTFGAVVIQPGQHNPEHHHPNCDEVLFVLEGELRHTVGDESHLLGPGDLIHIPQGVRHQGLNVGTVPCRVVVAYNSGRRRMVVDS